MKIIFLDIDGVLNYCHMPDFDKAGKDIHSRRLSKSRINLLNTLTDETDAKIVISSTWRNFSNSGYDPLKILPDAGVTGEIIGSTPIAKRTNVSVLRGNEIYTWMNDNPKLCGGSPANFKSYVILDDDSE